ncbi:hypothetical protein ABK040_001087 [Willaertia magna]
MSAIPVSQDGKVTKQILKEGSGEQTPPLKSQVYVHYTGVLESNGKEFDSSVRRGEPFVFTLGVGEVIRGWDLCVKTMKLGEKCKCTIPSDYAYGNSGVGKIIPPKATLVFDIELLKWE